MGQFKTSLGLSRIHVFDPSTSRPKRCAFCGRAMADHPLYEYRPVKEKA